MALVRLAPQSTPENSMMTRSCSLAAAADRFAVALLACSLGAMSSTCSLTLGAVEQVQQVSVVPHKLRMILDWPLDSRRILTAGQSLLTSSTMTTTIVELSSGRCSSGPNEGKQRGRPTVKAWQYDSCFLYLSY